MSDALWKGALPDTPDVLTACVLGAAGVGKTTLVRALMRTSKLRATRQRSTRLRAGKHGLDALKDDGIAPGTRVAKLPVAYRAGARLVAHVDSPCCERHAAHALRAASVADIAIVVVSATGAPTLRDALLVAWSQRVPRVVVWVGGVDAFEGWDAGDREAWTLEVREALDAMGAWAQVPVFFGSALEALELLRRERGRRFVLETPALAPVMGLLDVLAVTETRPVDDGALRLAVGWRSRGYVPEAGRRLLQPTVIGRLERGAVAVGDTVEVTHAHTSDRMDLGHREGGSGRVWLGHHRVAWVFVAGMRAERARAGDWVGLALEPQDMRWMPVRTGALVTSPGSIERDDWATAVRVRALWVPERRDGQTRPAQIALPARAEVHVWTPTGASRARWEALDAEAPQGQGVACVPLDPAHGVRARLRLVRPLRLALGARWVATIEGRVAAVGEVEAVEAWAPERVWYEGGALLDALRVAHHSGAADDAVADGLALWGARDVCETLTETSAAQLPVALDYLTRHIALARDKRGAESPEGLWQLMRWRAPGDVVQTHSFVEIKAGRWRGLRLSDAPVYHAMTGRDVEWFVHWRMLEDWTWRRWALGREGRLCARSEVIYDPSDRRGARPGWCVFSDVLRWDRGADVVHRVVRRVDVAEPKRWLRLEYARVGV